MRVEITEYGNVYLYDIDDYLVEQWNMDDYHDLESVISVFNTINTVLKNNNIEIDKCGSVFIYDNNGNEIVMWDSAEYEDVYAVTAALNAIRLADMGQYDFLKYIKSNSTYGERLIQ